MVQVISEEQEKMGGFRGGRGGGRGGGFRGGRDGGELMVLLLTKLLLMSA